MRISNFIWKKGTHKKCYPRPYWTRTQIRFNMPIQNFIARKNELPSYEIIEIHVNFKIKNYLGTLTLAPILGAFSKFLMIILTDFFLGYQRDNGDLLLWVGVRWNDNVDIAMYYKNVSSISKLELSFRD